MPREAQLLMVFPSTVDRIANWVAFAPDHNIYIMLSYYSPRNPRKLLEDTLGRWESMKAFRGRFLLENRSDYLVSLREVPGGEEQLQAAITAHYL